MVQIINIDSKILFDETTETDSKRLKQAMNAAKGYSVQEDPNAPFEQCEKLIFNLDISIRFTALFFNNVKSIAVDLLSGC